METETFHHPQPPLPLWQVTIGKNYTSSDARKFTPTLAQFTFFRLKFPISAMGTIYRIRAGLVMLSGLPDSPFELPDSSSLGVLFLFRQQR